MARELTSPFEHFRLVLNGRNKSALDEVAKEVQQLGAKATVVVADLADPATPEKIVTAAISSYKKIDCLILAAGVSMGFRFEEMTDMTAARKIMEVNYFANVSIIKLALPYGIFLDFRSALLWADLIFFIKDSWFKVEEESLLSLLV